MSGRFEERSRRWSLSAACSLLAGVFACAIDSRSLDDPSCPDGEDCGEIASGAGAGGASQTPGLSGSAGSATPGAGGSGAQVPALGGSAGESSAGGSGNAVNAGGSSSGGAGAGAGGGVGSAGAPATVGGCPTNLLVNGGFEAGEAPWVSYTTGQDPLVYDFTVETYDGVDPHGGLWLGWLGGVPSEINRLSQTVTVPANATSLGLQYSLRVQVFEPHANIDYLRIRLVIAGQPTQVAQFTNADASEEWVDLTPPALPLTTNGQDLGVVLEIESEISAGPGTNFYLDDLALVPTCTP